MGKKNYFLNNKIFTHRVDKYVCNKFFLRKNNSMNSALLAKPSKNKINCFEGKQKKKKKKKEIYNVEKYHESYNLF